MEISICRPRAGRVGSAATLSSRFISADLQNHQIYRSWNQKNVPGLQSSLPKWNGERGHFQSNLCAIFSSGRFVPKTFTTLFNQSRSFFLSFFVDIVIVVCFVCCQLGIIHFCIIRCESFPILLYRSFSLSHSLSLFHFHSLKKHNRIDQKTAKQKKEKSLELANIIKTFPIKTWWIIRIGFYEDSWMW